MIKRYIMRQLFLNKTSKDIVQNFEESVESFSGSDHDFLFDVNIDLECEYFHYKHENVDYAFQIYLRTTKLTDELKQYLVNDLSPVDLKTFIFDNKL